MHSHTSPARNLQPGGDRSINEELVSFGLKTFTSRFSRAPVTKGDNCSMQA